MQATANALHSCLEILKSNAYDQYMPMPHAFIFIDRFFASGLFPEHINDEGCLKCLANSLGFENS